MVITGVAGSGKTALAQWFAATDGRRFPGGCWFEDFSTVPLDASRQDWKRFAYDGLRRVAVESGHERALLILDEEAKRPLDVWGSRHADGYFQDPWDALPGSTMALSALSRLAPQLSCLITRTADPWGSDGLPHQRGKYSVPEASWLNIPLRPLSGREIGDIVVQEAHGSRYSVRQLVKRTGADPEIASIVLALARHGESADLVLERFEPVLLPGLVDPDGRPLTPDDEIVEVSQHHAAAIRQRLVDRIAHRPELMRSLTPREFEELVAELYAGEGYEVELTPASNDGGYDILARQKVVFGTFTTLIECKRYAETNPIGVDVVRQLYGVVESEGAHAGVVATTARFTSGSVSFAEKSKRIHLQDYFSLQDMMTATGRRF